MLICIHHKTYGSENKNQKIEHIVYKKNRQKLHKYTIQYTANAMMRNKIYTLSILIVPNSFIKNLSEACTGRLPALPVSSLPARVTPAEGAVV